MIEHFTLLPGAQVVSVEIDGQRRYAQVGVPPAIKLWLQRRLPPPTVFVLPHRLYHRGVVQASLEFFVYHFLFVSGRPPGSARMRVIGTADQLARCRRSLQVSLFGFDEDEMRGWRGPDAAPLDDADLQRIVDSQRFLAPRKPGFDATLAEALRDVPPDAMAAARRAAYAAGRLDLDDVIEWVAFDEKGRASLFEGVEVTRVGAGVFRVRDADSQVEVCTDFDDDQAPWLVALPPASEAVSPEVFKVVCLGSDPGFEVEHPTTGFAVSLNGMWAVIDAPLCASHLLALNGIDPADVRVVFETHGHEDHMGSGIHFMLECLTSGRAVTYVAAEPVYRTCVVKVAAVLGIDEDHADRLLTGRHGETEVRTRVIRMSARAPARLLGATWHVFWMVHPIPTTGFRIELEHDGKTRVVSFSSDTAPLGGPLGVERMRAEGFLPDDVDPYAPVLQGDEDLVFFEAGGTSGDPLHFNAREWERVCEARGISPTVVFMHAHLFPPELRQLALARPGMSWTLAAYPPMPVHRMINVVSAIRGFGLADEAYWLSMFLSQGRLEKYYPGALVGPDASDDESWFIVLQGRAEMHIEPEGVIGMLGSSDLFGHLAHHDERALRVRASTYLEVLRLPGEVFREFVVSNGLYDFFANLWTDVASLGRSRLFLGFPHQVLSALAQRATRREYAAGDVLIEEGEVGTEMFVIIDGELEVFSQSRPTPWRRGPGEIVGEYGALVRDARRTATVRARVRTSVLVLTGPVVEEIVAGEIPLRVRLSRLIEERHLPPLSS